MSYTVTLQVKDSSPMNAYVSVPEGKGPFPAVMVFQEAFGVNSHIRDVADRIAGLGYLAIAPELFHRTAPAGFEAPYDNFALVQPHFTALTTVALEADVQAVYDWLLTQDNVDKSKIGSIGFCLGGRVSFIANSTVKLQAAVSFYGGSMHTIAGRAEQCSAPQLLFWGGKDKHILAEHRDAVIHALQESGKDYINVVISYADHAFFCDQRPAYHPDAAREAWGMTKEFFRNKFGLSS